MILEVKRIVPTLCVDMRPLLLQGPVHAAGAAVSPAGFGAGHRNLAVGLTAGIGAPMFPAVRMLLPNGAR